MLALVAMRIGCIDLEGSIEGIGRDDSTGRNASRNCATSRESHKYDEYSIDKLCKQLRLQRFVARLRVSPAEDKDRMQKLRFNQLSGISVSKGLLH